MILQRAYHKLQEWIIMLDSPDFKNTDAELVRGEMMGFAGEIWLNRNAENTKSELNSQQHEEIPAMGRTEDSLGSGKTKHNSPADTQIQNEINKDYALEGTEVKE